MSGLRYHARVKRILANVEQARDAGTCRALAAQYDARFFLYEVRPADAVRVARALFDKCRTLHVAPPEHVALLAREGERALPGIYRQWLRERKATYGGEILERKEAGQWVTLSQSEAEETP